MNPKRPTTYVQWRKLYWDTAREIGFFAAIDWQRCKRLRVDRNFWRLLHRIDRIKRRLHAEFEAFDRTCAQALLELVFDKGPTT